MWAAIAPLLGSLWNGLTKLFLGLWLVKAGKDKQQLSDYKEEEKQIEKSKKIANGIDDMSDDELRKLLRDPKAND